MFRYRNLIIAITLVLSLLGATGGSAGMMVHSWGDEQLIQLGVLILELQLSYLPAETRYLLMSQLVSGPMPGVLHLQGGLLNLVNPAATSLGTVDSGDIANLGRITTTDNGTTHLSYTKDNFLKWYNYSLGVGWTINDTDQNYFDSDSGSIGNDPVVGGFDAATFGFNMYRSPNGGTAWDHLRTVTSQNGQGILGRIFGGERNSMAIDHMTGLNCVLYSQRTSDTTEESRINCADGSNFLFDRVITSDTTNLAGDNTSANHLAITYTGEIVGNYSRRQTGTMYAFRVDRLTQALEIFPLGDSPTSGHFGFAGTNSSWSDYRGLVPLGNATMARAWTMDPIKGGGFSSAPSGPVTDPGPIGMAMVGDLTLRGVYQRGGDTYIATEGGIFSDGFEPGDTSRWSSKQ